jgi:hypothetical protein
MCDSVQILVKRSLMAKWVGASLLAATLMLASTGSASAQDPGVWQLPPGTQPPVKAPLPAGETGQAGGGTASPITPDEVVAKRLKRCRSTGHGKSWKRVCRFYRAAKLVKKCIKRHGKRRKCRSYAGSAARVNSG